MQKLFYIVLIFSVCSCASQLEFSEAIEDVFRQAGKNRKELEKVLRHYGKDPADSLKLRAAEFLIVNMPGKYSEYFDAPWNDVATVLLRWTSSSNKQLVLDTYQLGELVRKDDITHITSDYLINNIELAFKVWHEVPWGKDIPFDIFCEEILPYRMTSEPLENWREKALASFADIYCLFLEDTTIITTVEACSRINKLLPMFRIDKDFSSMCFSQLMASARGHCDEMSALAVFSMRALGIPVSFDYTPMWPDWNRGHSWSNVYSNSGKRISFMGAEANPGESHIGSSKFRYFRYVSPPDGFCNVALIEIYNGTGEKLHGTVTGTTGSWNNSPMTYDKVFDGDPTTYFDAAVDTAWAGLDFGEPETIARIRYLPRNDGYGIYEGHEYELLHWEGNEWSSLGMKTANNHILQFDAPTNALFILKNITKNSFYWKPCIVDNGVQKWLADDE